MSAEKSLDGENLRRERTKREEMHRKLRSGESLDRRHREPERDERREREKPKERDREEERRRRDERERRKERERDGERRGSERRGEGDERENRDREKERQRERYKDRDREREGEPGREKEREKHRDRERDRDKERSRDIDRDRERSERHKDREKKEREKDKERNRDRDRDKEKDRYKDRERDERYRDREREKDREKEKDRERRRAEKERQREVGEEKYREKDKEREREKRERHSEYSGHTDREERRERRRREKEYSEAGERYHSDPRETERDRRHRDEENGRLRDREERDKRKEKKQEESKKGSSDHRHDKYDSRLRKSDQEVSAKRPELSWRAKDAELSDPEIPMENEDSKDNNKGDEDYENEEYEEDFEDYEEDFEEMEEEEEDEEKGEEGEVRDVEGEEDRRRELSPRRRKEIEAIQRAMQHENELVSSAHSRPSTSKAEPTQKVVADSESHTKKGRTHGRVIDFTAARQREVSQQTADKQKKRSAELLRLIDLDYSVTMCLLDLPPVSEYDMYIKSFGMANTKQAYVQCNEDNTDRDTQTEETDTVDKWTQHPPESNTACGGPKASQDTSDESVVRMNIDSKRLTTFLRSAAQVMAVLLEENRAENRNSVKQLHSQTDSLSFSEGCLHLNTKLPFLQGRQVTLLHFSQVQTHTLLSVHASGSSEEQLESKTLICVWNVWEPSAPQRILIYEAEVRCCCFSPGKATLVFAGTAVGSVVLWDLREHSGAHSSLSADGEEFTLRYPTFSTDAVLAGAGHFSSVVSVEPVVVNVESGIRGSFLEDQEESLGLLFQLGSLDENGLLNLWVVTELPKADDSGSQTDLGLRPGGKVKLLHSSSIQTSDRSTRHEVTGVTPLLSLLLKFLPSDSNHYFIGTNMGVVRRGTRHGLRAVPKLYRPEDGERPADITALDFCPSGEPFFLVGCSDGTVRLHSVLREEPVSEWSTGSGDVPVLSVLWSRTRPSVFCVLDAASVLHIWDLAEKDMCPVITESFQTDRVNAMAVFGEATRQNRYSGMALAKQSGRLEIHFLKPPLTVPQPSDSEKLHLLAQDNI
ncbi:cytoplasmic dynein 2 intermediate chain 1 isoform X2 [Astyanax mexicanus]|uniref:cytoplasmic dynein 2 intermediate chain 1 isoform X2 n=1 Tax=Astyanax mexicanus TaxID=7994 RepID=UPI0020CB4958|nr:cytoplasmic dynein 2 intermediate chain 1 isoform X2 [Astyanax mexicanus]